MQINEGISNAEIAARTGVTLGQVAAVKAQVSMGNYGDNEDAGFVDTDVANAVDTARLDWNTTCKWLSDEDLSRLRKGFRLFSATANAQCHLAELT